MQSNPAPTDSLLAADSRLFFSRQDPDDPRLGELAQAVRESDLAGVLRGPSHSPKTTEFALIGYPDDEGIRIGGGRAGAALAPDHVRKFLYRMTPNLLNADLRAGAQEALGQPAAPPYRILDLGNLKPELGSIEERHRVASRLGHQTLKLGGRWIGIGGGHDYGFAEASAYIDWFGETEWAKTCRPLVINFDAHLDVRPVNRGLSSGTPFFRMLEKYPGVDFAALGVQTHCNSRAHFAWAKAHGVRVLAQEEVQSSGETFSTAVIRTLGDWVLRPRPIFLSIDLDGFDSSQAPGCSQSWATGFTAQEFFPCLQILARRLLIQSLGIYELSPPLDHDERTAKLAAQIIHRVLDPL